MKLRLSYDLNDRIFSLSSADRSGDCATVLSEPGVVVDFPEPHGMKPVGLEVFGFSPSLPLGREGYSVETDTLCYGDMTSATVVEENKDLVAYFGPIWDVPDYLYLLGVELRNATKHLAPLIPQLE